MKQGHRFLRSAWSESTTQNPPSTLLSMIMFACGPHAHWWAVLMAPSTDYIYIYIYIYVGDYLLHKDEVDLLLSSLSIKHS
jgi:hypothetical protein